jgi:hypothetical protein
LSAVAALAMGIGFTTTMFSIVHGGTRRLPFSDPHELVVAAKTTPRVGSYDYAASVEPIEPAGVLTYVALAGTLGATALVGLLRPVRRALALEPVTALRLE